MEIACTSMIHARAPYFLWPYVVRYAAHQLNLWPHVSWPEASPTCLWTGSPGVASKFRVWGCVALIRDISADKLSARALPCVFLGFSMDALDFAYYHPPLHRFLDSRDVTFEEFVSYYAHYLCRGLPIPLPPISLAPAPPLALAPPVDPPPPGPAPSCVSHAIPLLSVARMGAEAASSGGAGAEGAGTGVGGPGTRGARSGGAGAGGTSTGGASYGVSGAGGADIRGASSRGSGTGGTTSVVPTPPPHRYAKRLPR
ncbi:unnamed protein product [Closterium sp. NIES-54]